MYSRGFQVIYSLATQNVHNKKKRDKNIKKERQQLSENSKVFFARVDVYEYHHSEGRASNASHVHTPGDCNIVFIYTISRGPCWRGEIIMNKRPSDSRHARTYLIITEIKASRHVCQLFPLVF